MKKSKNKIAEFIRVDHAGERGAVKIYEGQLLALSTLVKDENLKKDRIILNMVDSPKLLWKNLVAKVRNCWIERYLFQIQCFSRLKTILKDI